MTRDEKDFLRQAIKEGKVFTTPIHSLGPIGTTAVKQVTIEQPYGKPLKRKRWLPFFGLR